jgi:hypothetical protein
MIKMIKNQRFTTGFTLMETMIYIALFALLMSGAIIGVYNLLEGSSRNVAATGIQEEGVFLNRKINWALSVAKTISPNPSGGDTLSIVTRPDSGVLSPLVISGADNKTLTIARGPGAPTQLNSDRYKVSNVKFSYLAGGNGKPASVSVSFLIEDKPFNFRAYLR